MSFPVCSDCKCTPCECHRYVNGGGPPCAVCGERHLPGRPHEYRCRWCRERPVSSAGALCPRCGVWERERVEREEARRAQREAAEKKRDELEALRAIPEMTELDGLTLREMRKALQLTQKQLGERMHRSQGWITQNESVEDLHRMTLGTLRRYVEALGGRLDVKAVFDRRKAPILRRARKRKQQASERHADDQHEGRELLRGGRLDHDHPEEQHLGEVAGGEQQGHDPAEVE